MSKKFDVVAITGKYTNSNGEEKSRYVTIGAVIETSKGLSLKLEAVPVGWDGWAGLYEPKAKDGAPARGKPQQRGGDDFDDTPFAPMAAGRAFLAM